MNFVWNYINELSYRSIRERGVFLSAFDIHPYTRGSGIALGLHSQTLQMVAAEYVTRRKQFKRARLNWRKSQGVRRSLGWIPINTGAASWKNGQVYHNALIVVGNVSSKAMTQTKLAKSALDAGWGILKTLLEYKCAHAGSVFIEVNEAYTTQTCSCCGSRRHSPKGRAGLGIREWTCECGVTHDRDVNAARNILALGHGRLAGGIPSL